MSQEGTETSSDSKMGLRKLKAKARPDQLEETAQFGMTTERRLGVSVPEMRKIAKELGKDYKLAIELWMTKISEARIVAAMIDGPHKSDGGLRERHHRVSEHNRRRTTRAEGG